jgi:nucleotide-binding universal stress UspA family protein
VIQRLLVGVDGSDSARKAAEFARDLARQTGAHLVVLIAVEPPEVASLGAFDAIAIRPVHPSPAQLARANEIAHGLGLGPEQLRIRIETGHPAEVITRVADEENADLVVVGARGIGRAEALILGSVSERLVRDARRPVTVVH